MKKCLTVILCFLFASGLVWAQEPQQESSGVGQVLVNSQQTLQQQDSIVDKIGDWFATLGKTPEEATGILDQRKQERNLGSLPSEVDSYKQEIQQTVGDVKGKIQQKVEEIKGNTTGQAGQLKEKAKNKVTDVKNKVNENTTSYKERLKQEADKKIEETKGFLNNLLK